jgi:hypothetical protein
MSIVTCGSDDDFAMVEQREECGESCEVRKQKPSNETKMDVYISIRINDIYLYISMHI